MYIGSSVTLQMLWPIAITKFVNMVAVNYPPVHLRISLRLRDFSLSIVIPRARKGKTSPRGSLPRNVFWKVAGCKKLSTPFQTHRSRQNPNRQNHNRQNPNGQNPNRQNPKRQNPNTHFHAIIAFVRKHYISIQRWKNKKKWEPWGGFIFVCKNEKNRGPKHGPRHGPKSEGRTFGLVAPSVFI